MLILEDLWRGNLCPGEEVVRPNSAYTALFRAVEGNESKLDAMLTGEGKTVLAAYTKAQADLRALSDCDSFIRGFRMGAKFMLDVMGSFEVPKAESS